MAQLDNVHSVLGLNYEGVEFIGLAERHKTYFSEASRALLRVRVGAVKAPDASDFLLAAAGLGDVDKPIASA